MKSKMKMIQLTVYSNLVEKIMSQYGKLTYSQWLAKEKERITADHTRYAEVREKNGRFALFVNKVA